MHLRNINCLIKRLNIKRLNGTKYSRMDQVKFFKGCFPQFLLGPFLNTWFQMALVFGDADSESNG